MILSSRNSFSVRTYLPPSLTVMMARANPVHHQDSNRVGLLSSLDLAWGGVAFMSRRMIMVAADAHQPPQRGERRSVFGGYLMKQLGRGRRKNWPSRRRISKKRLDHHSIAFDDGCRACGELVGPVGRHPDANKGRIWHRDMNPTGRGTDDYSHHWSGCNRTR